MNYFMSILTRNTYNCKTNLKVDFGIAPPNQSIMKELAGLREELEMWANSNMKFRKTLNWLN